MFHLSVRPRRLLGSAIQVLSLSVIIGVTALAARAELQGGTSSSSVAGGVSQAVLNGETKQNQLNGSSVTDALSTGIRSTTLKGGIKDDAALRNSLRLLKPSTDRPTNLPTGTSTGFVPGAVTQFSGSASRGALAPQWQPGSPVNATYGRGLSGTMAPISTYTMTRTNSRMWVAPGYEVIPGTTSQSSAAVPPTKSSSFSSTYKQTGQQVYMPGYEVSSISQVVGAGALLPMRGDRDYGVAAYAPEYAVHKVSIAPQKMLLDPASITTNGVTAYAPGYEVTVTSRNKGVMVWTPGYELSRVVPGAVKESLSGVWHSGLQPTALLARQGVLPQSQFTKILVGPPMVATGLLLPQLRAQALEKITWDEWYKRVARAIYCRWQYAEVGPGVATIRMVVTKDRDISCQLIDFKPATDTRDVAAETLFRESAVKAVNMVTKFEIPDLPGPTESDKVVFDLDLKRVVDGPVGVDVASSHR
jgi:hypothetical protein